MAKKQVKAITLAKNEAKKSIKPFCEKSAELAEIKNTVEDLRPPTPSGPNSTKGTSDKKKKNQKEKLKMVLVLVLSPYNPPKTLDMDKDID